MTYGNAAMMDSRFRGNDGWGGRIGTADETPKTKSLRPLWLMEEAKIKTEQE
jgi:hypothetical protein